MKIICVGRNYSEHAAELQNDLPEEPVVFLKPDSAILKEGQDFYVPDFSTDIHHEVELIVRIEKHGKHIQEKFAHKYYDKIALGIDFTARDKQSYLKNKGLPWELSKAFDGSAYIGTWMPLASFSDSQNINFYLRKNGVVVQNGFSRDMIFSIDKLIAFISKYFTLKTGDILFTGTPMGVSSVKAGDILEAFFGEKEGANLTCKVK